MSLVLGCFVLSVVCVSGCGKKDKEETTTKKTEEKKTTDKDAK
jgi:hypothetical protein